jgi:WD40 repeat protein
MRKRPCAGLTLLAVTLSVAALAASGRPETPAELGGQDPPLTDRYGDPLPKGAIFRLGTVRFCQPFPWCLAFSPDGRILASGGYDNRIRFWDPDTGKELRRLEGHTGSVNGIAFSADGKWLASGGQDKVLCLWEVASGKERRRFTGHAAPIEHMALSPDGKVLASSGQVGTLRLWDTGTGKEIRSLPLEKNSRVAALALSPDGKHLAFTSGPGTGIRLVDVADGTLVRTFEGHNTVAGALAFSADGTTLISGGGVDRTIRAWDVATGKERRRYGDETNLVRCLAIASDGKTLTYGTYPDGLAHIWDLAANKDLVAPWKANRWCVVSIAYSPDSKKVALGRDTIAIHETATGKRLNPTAESEARVKQLEYAAGGGHLAVWRDDETIELWDTAKWRKTATLKAKVGRFSAMAFSPGGKSLTTAEGNYKQGSLRHWDPQTGKRQKEFPQGMGWIEVLSYSADGATLAAIQMSQRRDFVLWDAATGKERGRIAVSAGHHGRAPRLSPDGRLIACGTMKNAVALWDTKTAKVVREFGKTVTSAREVHAFSPDGRALVSPGGQSKDGNMPIQPDFVLWETATGRERFRLAMNDGPASQLAFSPDGRLLATAGRGETIHLWDAWTGKEAGRFTGHRGWMGSLAFAPDGKTLASGGADSTVLIWDVSRLPGGKASSAAPTGAEFAKLWEALADPDAAKAALAMAALAYAPGRSEPFLKEALGKNPAGESPEIKRLIADLDSIKFAVREKATDALARLGKQAVPALWRALEAKPSAEASRRIASLLAKLDGGEIDPNQLRMLRAVEVLERLGGAEARQLLKIVADGYAENDVRQEARASLDRLAKRSASR